MAKTRPLQLNRIIKEFLQKFQKLPKVWIVTILFGYQNRSDTVKPFCSSPVIWWIFGYSVYYYTLVKFLLCDIQYNHNCMTPQGKKSAVIKGLIKLVLVIALTCIHTVYATIGIGD